MVKKIIIGLICVCCCGVVSAQSYHIGDVYIAPDGSKGIVYYLHPDGSGGWVVALNDVSAACVWGDNTDVPGLLNYNTQEQQLLNDTAGYANTLALRNYQNNNSYAAGVVDFAHGWVLPSPAQLSKLYAQLPFISSALTGAGGTEPTTDFYWCSAEYSASNAWCIDFGSTSNYHLYSGQFYNTAKNSSCRVRAVRRFDYSSGSNISYLWNTGATTTSVTVSPAQTTTYTVTVTTSNGCSDTAQHTILVNVPVGEYINATACDSYAWNGTTYYESSDYTYAHPDANGCTQVDTLHLTILGNPDATITATSETICVGDEVTLQTQVTVPSSGPVLHVPPVAIGDILCTDNSIVKPANWPAAGRTAMGVVFYVDNTGEHGWAVHLQDQGSSLAWGGYGTDIPSLPNHSGTDIYTDLNGYSNTQAIRAAGNATSYPAAWAVDFNNGWYLPANGQLRVLLSTIVFINATLDLLGGQQFPMDASYTYWSSTEHSANYAGYTQNNDMGGRVKWWTSKVRSVRSF